MNIPGTITTQAQTAAKPSLAFFLPTFTPRDRDMVDLILEVDAQKNFPFDFDAVDASFIALFAREGVILHLLDCDCGCGGVIDDPAQELFSRFLELEVKHSDVKVKGESRGDNLLSFIRCEAREKLPRVRFNALPSPAAFRARNEAVIHPYKF